MIIIGDRHDPERPLSGLVIGIPSLIANRQVAYW
jgi:hypothetical protein